MTTTDICYTMCRGEGSPMFLILSFVAPLVIGAVAGFFVGYLWRKSIHTLKGRVL